MTFIDIYVVIIVKILKTKRYFINYKKYVLCFKKDLNIIVIAITYTLRNYDF